MKVAVIDLGTNTFHLMVAEVTADTYQVVHREKVPVKIGEKGINKGKITPEAQQRSLKALMAFKAEIDKREITHVYGTATSAFRNASNGKALVHEIKQLTGIEIDIIDGLKEAELIYKGAKSALSLSRKMELIIDIGGGSVEFILADNEKAHWMHSFEVGGQRLLELFLPSDPITREQIASLHTYFEDHLRPLFQACEIHNPTTLIGCSGTFETLSQLYSEKHSIQKEADATELPFSISAFEELYDALITKNRQERLAMPGMIEMRVDMIVVACVLIDFLVKKVSLRSIRVSAYALKEGILMDVIDSIKKA